MHVNITRRAARVALTAALLTTAAVVAAPAEATPSTSGCHDRDAGVPEAVGRLDSVCDEDRADVTV